MQSPAPLPAYVVLHWIHRPFGKSAMTPQRSGIDPLGSCARRRPGAIVVALRHRTGILNDSSNRQHEVFVKRALQTAFWFARNEAAEIPSADPPVVGEG